MRPRRAAESRAASATSGRPVPAAAYALPYLRVRALTFMPAMLSTVGFAAFRGLLDTKTPLYISALANALNVVLDPVLIFGARVTAVYDADPDVRGGPRRAQPRDREPVC